MGVPFEGSFLLRGQFLSHLDLTRAGLAPVYRQDIGTRPARLESHLESVLLYSRPRQKAAISSGTCSLSHLHSKRERTERGRGRENASMRTQSLMYL